VIWQPTKALTRKQIRYVIKVHALDKAARARVGKARASNGLYRRLARALGVKERLIADICQACGPRKRFRDINIFKERHNAKRNKTLVEGPAPAPRS
jgi:hypothetical protein